MYRVIIYTPAKDRHHIEVDSLQTALKIIGKRKVRQRVKWGGITDIFFEGTLNYIRVNNNERNTTDKRSTHGEPDK